MLFSILLYFLLFQRFFFLTVCIFDHFRILFFTLYITETWSQDPPPVLDCRLDKANNRTLFFPLVHYKWKNKKIKLIRFSVCSHFNLLPSETRFFHTFILLIVDIQESRVARKSTLNYTTVLWVIPDFNIILYESYTNKSNNRLEYKCVLLELNSCQRNLP